MRAIAPPFVFFSILFFSGSLLLAQTQGDPLDDAASASAIVVNPTPPPTNLQKLEIEKNTLILKGYTELARVAGEANSAVRVLACEMHEANGPSSNRGVVFVIASARSADWTANAYIDADEIDALASAMDDIQKSEKNLTPLAEFETRYRSRGDLEVANLNIDGSRMIVLKANQTLYPSGRFRSSTAYFRPTQLAEIRRQLLAAKTALDRLGK